MKKHHSPTPHQQDNKPLIIYGFHAVESAITNDTKNVARILVEKNSKNKRVASLMELAQKHAIPYEQVSRDVIDTQAHTTKHQGVAAAYHDKKSQTATSLPEILKKDSLLLLILDGVQDPHNLGACLRSANAAGVDAVIAPKDRAVGLTPAVRKVAAGAAENTPFIQVTNLAQTIKMLKDADVWCYGAAGETDTSLYDLDLTGRTAIVLGSEGTGLRRLTRETCDALFTIPMDGSVESLNVSVATGISLFEARRQRQNIS